MAPPARIGTGRVPALDGLRALAILPVILFHTALETRFPIDLLGPAMTLVVNGWMGVDLFFALSGFLITRLWIEEERGRSAHEAAHGRAGGPATRSVGRFYGRRALRILPPLYTMLAFDLLLMPALGDFRSIAPLTHAVRSNPLEVLPYALLYMNYVARTAMAGTAFTICWSLCVEEHFYLLWPWVLATVRSRRGRLAIALGVCLLVGAARWIGTHHLRPHGAITAGMLYRRSHYRIDSILWGAAAAVASEELARLVTARRAVMGAILIAVAALVWTGRLSPYNPTPLGTGVGYSMIALGATLLTVEVVSAPETALARFLATKPLRSIGFLSYGMYLLHVPAIELGARLVFTFWRSASPWHFWLMYSVSVAITYALALALHHAVERPLASLRARLRPLPAAASSARTESSAP